MTNSFVKDFVAFLKEHKVVSLAIAFIMGVASTDLINSLVKDIIMPIIEPLMAGGKWKEAVLTIGNVHISYGLFLGQLINFIIIGIVVFIVANKFLKSNKE